MKPASNTLKNRVLDFIVVAGSRGVTRTQLMQRFQIRSQALDLVLNPLVAEKRIKQQHDPKRHTLGRPALRFYAPDVELDLTPTEKPAMPVLPFGEAPAARTSNCQTCGVAIPLPEVGRPHVFCSDACRRASRDGGLTVRDFIGRTSDARILARVALCLVMADLTIRGFQVAVDLFGPLLRLVVHDGAGIAFLDVLLIGESGHFPPPDTYESVAYVYRDGRIVYSGRAPLVEEPVERPPEDA